MMGIIQYNPKLKSLASKLRKEGSLAEIMMWKTLRKKQLLGYDWHRQKPIDNYIVDFFCPKLKLIIEIDGSSHIYKYQSDITKEKRLEGMGLVVLRFSEADVRNNLEEVLISIRRWIKENTPRPADVHHPSQELTHPDSASRRNHPSQEGMKIVVIILLLIFPLAVRAAVDTDGDGLSDYEETNVYFTDANNGDTDGDGFSDGEEIANHYSPHQPDKSLSQTDYDNDGLSDWQELQFKTNLNNPDSDGDGHSDFEEISNSFDPLNKEAIKLPQKIVINTTRQTLTATLNDIPLATWPVSTGKAGYDTPAGDYNINNKVLRAWSKTYGLWMPYWMSFIGNKFGIHELPEWPGGLKEGANHLGTAVSHGCVRLGVGPAQWLYEWAQVGTSVEVIK